MNCSLKGTLEHLRTSAKILLIVGLMVISSYLLKKATNTVCVTTVNMCIEKPLCLCMASLSPVVLVYNV